MAYKFFNQDKFRNDVRVYAGAFSYRHIEKVTNKKISYSKAVRIVNKEANLCIEDIQVLMKMMDTDYDNYIIKHMF